MTLPTQGLIGRAKYAKKPTFQNFFFTPKHVEKKREICNTYGVNFPNQTFRNKLESKTASHAPNFDCHRVRRLKFARDHAILQIHLLRSVLFTSETNFV